MLTINNQPLICGVLSILCTWFVMDTLACMSERTEPPEKMKKGSCQEGKNIEDADYRDKVFDQKKPVGGKPKTVFVKVLVVVEKELYKKIIKKYKEGGKAPPRFDPSTRSSDDLEREVVLYVRKFMTAVNLGFRTFTNPRIEFSIAGVIHKLKKKFGSGVQALKPWEENRKMKDRIDKQPGTYHYDVILTLVGRRILQSIQSTRYDILKKQPNPDDEEIDKTIHDGVYGTSGLGEACSPNKGSIFIQDLGQFSGLKTAVHHFGHFLGSRHDGENNDCCSSDFYRMSNFVFDATNSDHVKKIEENAHKWSSCSKKLIEDFVIKAPCLHNRPKNDKYYTLFSWQQLGDSNIPSLKEQCYGYYKETEKGKHCNQRNDLNVCNHLQCSNSDVQCEINTINYAMEGSVCQVGKVEGRCLQGKCIKRNKKSNYLLILG